MKIKASFQIKNNAICAVNLEENSQDGCCWQIQSDQHNHSLSLLIHEWMNAYINQQQPQVSLPLAWPNFTPFTQKVLSKLETIPYGQTLSYQELALEVGHPKASRAVGNACGRNPFPLIIPCHRILASNCRLGGFSQGLEIKRRLLTFEHIHWHTSCTK